MLTNKTIEETKHDTIKIVGNHLERIDERNKLNIIKINNSIE